MDLKDTVYGTGEELPVRFDQLLEWVERAGPYEQRAYVTGKKHRTDEFGKPRLDEPAAIYEIGIIWHDYHEQQSEVVVPRITVTAKGRSLESYDDAVRRAFDEVRADLDSIASHDIEELRGRLGVPR